MHDFSEGDLNHGFGGFGIELVVQGDSSEVVEPGERPFDDPSQRDDIELLRSFIGSKHNFELATERPSHLLLQLLAPVSTVGDKFLQPRELVGEPGQGRFRALAVVDVRPVDGNSHRKPQRVDHHLILAPLHLLVAVYAAFPVDVLAGLDAP